MTRTELLEAMSEFLNKDLRRIIREEIEYALQKTDISETRLSSISRTLNDTPSKPKIDKNAYVEKRKREIMKTRFSTVPEINEMLREQALDGIEQELIDIEEDMEYKEIYNRAKSGEKKLIEDKGLDLNEAIPEDKRGRNIPEHIQQALTRDYSELTKVMSKQKGGFLAKRGLTVSKEDLKNEE